MAQTNNNNLSCLPFYESAGEISSKLPWAYGDIFPLRCDNRLLPFLATRPKTTNYAAGEEIYHDTFDSGAYIAPTGEIAYTTSGVTVAVCSFEDLTAARFFVVGGRYALWVQDVPYKDSVDGNQCFNVCWRASGGAVIGIENVGTRVEGEYYTGLIFAPVAWGGKGTISLDMLSSDGGADTATVYTPVLGITPVSSTHKLYDTDGNVTEINFTANVVNLDSNTDLIYYSGDTEILTSLRGTFRLELATGADGVMRYSDWFTVGAVPNVRIEWYNSGDQQIGRGVIPYESGYVNRLWLNTSVGFPEYEIDKEGDETDGYFFMAKGVSRKSYRMSFYAPEYLCDVLRLLPISDFVHIYDTSRGREIAYDVDDIDMEVEWQETGNYASVTLTFKTDTVVKNLGKII